MDELAREANLPVRNVRPEDTSTTIIDTRWSFPETLRQISEWTKEMSEDVFQRGSIVEKFVYAFTLFMVAGPGEAVNQAWCSEAIDKVEGWLINLM